MKFLRYVLMGVVAASMLSVAAPSTAADAALKVDYPEGWRDWTHVKSMVIFAQTHPLFGAFGGIHHIYANDSAVKALKSKSKLPVGAKIVFDLLAIDTASGAHTEAARKFTAVMEYDPKKFAATEGWGWQAWGGDSKTNTVLNDLASQKSCSTCHDEMAGEAKQHVLTEWRK